MTDLPTRAADKVAQLTVAVKNQRLKVKHNLEGPQEGRLFRLIAADEGEDLVALETELHLYELAQQQDYRTALKTAGRIVSAAPRLESFGGEAGRRAAKKWLADNLSPIMTLTAGTAAGMEIVLRDLFESLT